MKIKLLVLAMLLIATVAAADDDCSWNGIPLHGRVMFVDTFADMTIEIVDSFPDLRVQLVDAFPNRCGAWQQVFSNPDFTVEIVDSFGDLRIQYVDSFPGLPDDGWDPGDSPGWDDDDDSSGGSGNSGGNDWDDDDDTDDPYTEPEPEDVELDTSWCG